MTAARLFVGACGLLYAGFGLWAMFNLSDALAFMALGDLDVPALNDLRGNYGGLNLAVGLYLLWTTARSAPLVPALAFIAILTGGYALGRVVSIGLDGMPPTVVLGYLALEATLAAAGLLLTRRLPVEGATETGHD